METFLLRQRDGISAQFLFLILITPIGERVLFLPWYCNKRSETTCKNGTVEKKSPATMALMKKCNTHIYFLTSRTALPSPSLPLVRTSKYPRKPATIRRCVSQPSSSTFWEVPATNETSSQLYEAQIFTSSNSPSPSSIMDNLLGRNHVGATADASRRTSLKTGGEVT